MIASTNSATFIKIRTIYFVLLIFLSYIAHAGETRKLKIIYKGLDKTYFVVEQAKILGKAFNIELITGPDNPDIYIFSDYNIFEKLKDEQYVQAQFPTLNGLWPVLQRSVLEGQVCVLASSRKSDGSDFSLLFVDATLTNAEIEICTLSQLQTALQIASIQEKLINV